MNPHELAVTFGVPGLWLNRGSQTPVFGHLSCFENDRSYSEMEFLVLYVRGHSCFGVVGVYPVKREVETGSGTFRVRSPWSITINESNEHPDLNYYNI